MVIFCGFLLVMREVCLLSSGCGRRQLCEVTGGSSFILGCVKQRFCAFSGFVFSLDGHFLLQPLSPAGWLPVAVTA